MLYIQHTVHYANVNKTTMTQHNDNDNGNHKITAKNSTQSHTFFFVSLSLMQFEYPVLSSKYDKYQTQKPKIWRGERGVIQFKPNNLPLSRFSLFYIQLFAHIIYLYHTTHTRVCMCNTHWVCICVFIWSLKANIFRLVRKKTFLRKTPSFPLVITIIYVLTAWRNTLIRLLMLMCVCMFVFTRTSLPASFSPPPSIYLRVCVCAYSINIVVVMTK